MNAGRTIFSFSQLIEKTSILPAHRAFDFVDSVENRNQLTLFDFDRTSVVFDIRRERQLNLDSCI